MQPLKNTFEKNALSPGAVVAHKAAPYSMPDQKPLLAQRCEFPEAGGWTAVARGSFFRWGAR